MQVGRRGCAQHDVSGTREHGSAEHLSIELRHETDNRPRRIASRQGLDRRQRARQRLLDRYQDERWIECVRPRRCNRAEPRVADKVGVSHEVIVNLEAGKIEPQIDLIQHIAGVLSRRLRDFIEE